MKKIVNKYIILVLLSFLISSCAAMNTRSAADNNSSLLDPPEISFIQQGKNENPDDLIHSEYDIENGILSVPSSCDPGNSAALPTGLVSSANEECSEDMHKLTSREIPTAEKGAVVQEKGDENEQNFLDAALEFYETSQDFWTEGNLERAIEALDQSYTNILKVDPDNNPELIQQIEDLRFMISKRILEIYASRYTAANGNHKAIPLVMNKHVESEIQLFQGPEREFFIESYKRSGRYRQEILEALEEAGLPEELSWLPLIESGFKVNALSRARALGLWQFIPSTGYKFGLQRNSWIDERLDPEKSTAAAIAYLKELHQIFGDWTTVLAAYNCGEGTVLKVIRQQKINYLDHFWDLYQMLPYETARYVPRFMATLHILKDPEKYGMELGQPDTPVAFDVVIIEKQVHLKKVAEKTETTFEELKSLNPELRYQATPDTPYPLRMPEGMGEVFSARLDEIPKWTPPRRQYAYHRVRRGETLSLIALKYRTSVSQIVRVNKIKRKNFIRVGQRLKIPLRGGTSKRRVYSKAKLFPDGTYKVRKGDSLWLIAQRFNTSTKDIQRLNNLTSTQLHVGQILKIKKM